MVDWLGEHYTEYVSTVSPDYMALSLPMLQRLVTAVEERQPKRILDLGSGISSYVLRRAAPDAEVWSIDTEAEWLGKSAAFTTEHGERAAHFAQWDDFIAEDRGLFDLVSHDMDWHVERMRVLRRVLSYVAPGGLLVLDDVNYGPLDSACSGWAELQGLTYTKEVNEDDTYKRHVGYITKPQDWTLPVDKGVRPLVAIPPDQSIPNEARGWMRALDAEGWPQIDMKRQPVMIARNRIAEHLLAHPQFTHVLMLDIDHEHPPDVVRRLCAHVARNRDRWIVGGVYVRRGEPYDPMAYRVNEQGGMSVVVKYENNCEPVDRLATGCMLIAREVFEAMPPPWFLYDASMARNGDYPSEDIYFCKRCREHGIQIYADYTVHSPHLDVVGRTFDDFQRYVDKHEGDLVEDGVLKLSLP